MKRFKELRESLRSEGAETYTVSKGTYTRKVDGKTADLLKKQGWKLMSREEAEEEVTEGFLGKDGEKGRDIKNAGLFDKETAYSLAKKVNGVIHKDPKSDKYHVKHGKGSNVSEESVEEASSTSPNMAKAVQGLNDLGYKLKGRDGKDVQRVEKLFRSGNKKVLQGAMRALDTDIRDQIMDILEPLGFVKDGVVESLDEALSPSYKNKYVGKDKASLQKSRNSFLSQIDDLIKFKKKTTKDPEVVHLQDLLKQVDYALKGVKESVDKYTSFSTQNKGRKPSLGQSKLSSAEYQKAKKLKGFNVDDWKWNGDLYIRVAEDVEESTDAYAASLEKIANDKKLKGITPKDREMLIKLAALMANEKK